MPGPVATTKAARAAQVARDKAAADRLTRAYLDTWARIKSDLTTLTAKMQEARDSETGKVPVSWLYREQRLQTLRAQVAQHVGQYAQYAHQTVSQEIRQAAHDGAQDAAASLASTIPVGVSYSFAVLPVKAVNHIVDSADSGRLAKLFGQFAPDAAQRAQTALIQGVAVGDGTDDIARRLRDALSIPLSRATTIARTETLTAYRAASTQTFQQNSDVLDGWIWLTGPDPCPECADQAGTLHDAGEEMDTHPNCRCVQQPKTKPWSEILSSVSSSDESDD